MNYTFHDYMDACEQARRAVLHLREQFSHSMDYITSKSLIEARQILIDAQEEALDKAQGFLLKGN